MPRLTPEEKQAKRAWIKKIMHAALILDIKASDDSLTKNGSEASLQQVSSNCREFSAKTKLTPSRYNWIALKVNASYIFTRNKSKAILEDLPSTEYSDTAYNHILKIETLKNLIKYDIPNIEITNRAPTEEEISWANTVLAEEKVDLSGVAINKQYFELTFAGSVPLTCSLHKYFENEEQAKEYQQKLISGEIPVTISTYMCRVSQANFPATKLKAVDVIRHEKEEY
jgi:hypothetical protein